MASPVGLPARLSRHCGDPRNCGIAPKSGARAARPRVHPRSAGLRPAGTLPTRDHSHDPKSPLVHSSFEIRHSWWQYASTVNRKSHIENFLVGLGWIYLDSAGFAGLLERAAGASPASDLCALRKRHFPSVFICVHLWLNNFYGRIQSD